MKKKVFERVISRVPKQICRVYVSDKILYRNVTGDVNKTFVEKKIPRPKNETL